jgi:hypothetical protein
MQGGRARTGLWLAAAAAAVGCLRRCVRVSQLADSAWQVLVKDCLPTAVSVHAASRSDKQ